MPVDAQSGCINLTKLKAQAAEATDRLAAIVFPQVNTFGLLEAVDELTDFALSCGVQSIAVIDPLLLAEGV